MEDNKKPDRLSKDERSVATKDQTELPKLVTKNYKPQTINSFFIFAEIFPV